MPTILPFAHNNMLNAHVVTPRRVAADALFDIYAFADAAVIRCHDAEMFRYAACIYVMR